MSTSSMLRAVALLAIIACGTPAPSHPVAPPAPAPARSDVHVDRRVELLSILMRFAGNPEYNEAPSTPYVAEVEAWFGPYRDHAAVVATRALSKEHEISFNAPMNLAIHLDDKLVPHDLADLGATEPRWATVDVEAYAASVRDFARTTRFDEFFAAHRDYYAKVAGPLRVAVDAEHPLAWFDERFGRHNVRFEVVPGLLAGAWNYGVRANRKDGSLDTMQVLGVWNADGTLTASAGTVETLIHEMAHSYVNPIFDRHEDALKDVGTRVFPLVARRLNKQGYDNWTTVVNESVVRATVAQFLRDRKGAAKRAESVRFEIRSGFAWMSEFADVIARIPNGELEAHVSDVTHFFEGFAASNASGIPRGPFAGPVDEALLGDTVFVAPSDPEGARQLTTFRDRVYPGAPIVTTSSDVLAAHPGKDLVLYGAAADPLIASVLARAGWRVEASSVFVAGKQFDGQRLVFIACAPRPDDPIHGIVVYTAYDARDIGDLSLWHGTEDWYVLRRTDHGYDRIKVGDFSTK